jgi:hypothetical protein
MKFCPKCKIEKDSLEFGKDSKSKSGLSCWCKKFSQGNIGSCSRGERYSAGGYIWRRKT